MTQIGIVGGGIRGSMFATAISQHRDATLVAMCEPVRAVAERNATALQIPVYDDVETMISSHPELSAAIIATPDFAHRDPAVRCAEAGLDLMIEKPLATTSAEAEEIAATAAASGSRVMIGFENRWNRKFAEVREQVAGGAHGAMVNQVANLNDTVFVPTQMLSWAGRSSPAWFLMPHTLDLTLWISGATPVEVFARGVRRTLPARGVDTWDAVTASFVLSDGSLVVLNSQWVLPESSPAVFDFRYEVHTEHAAFHFDISDSGVTRYDAEKASWLQFGVYEHHGQLRGIPIDMAADFVAMLNGEDRDLPDAAYGVLVTRAVEAVHRSLESGRPEPV